MIKHDKWNEILLTVLSKEWNNYTITILSLVSRYYNLKGTKIEPKLPKNRELEAKFVPALFSSRKWLKLILSCGKIRLKLTYHKEQI